MRNLGILLLAYALALHAGLAAARPMSPAAVLCHAQGQRQGQRQGQGTPPHHPARDCDLCCRLTCHGVALPEPGSGSIVPPRRTVRLVGWRRPVAGLTPGRTSPLVRARGPPDAI